MEWIRVGWALAHLLASTTLNNLELALMLACKRDVGAGSSELTYQALAGVAYGFLWGNLSLTYRYLYFDEGDDGLVKDLSLGGPVLGAGFRF